LNYDFDNNRKLILKEINEEEKNSNKYPTINLLKEKDMLKNYNNIYKHLNKKL